MFWEFSVMVDIKSLASGRVLSTRAPSSTAPIVLWSKAIKTKVEILDAVITISYLSWLCDGRSTSKVRASI
uniref:Uncharacterized protein n=1 Tax=Cucumis melo TaxID=3656 RepID=A0A9I9E722_CUCME